MAKNETSFARTCLYITDHYKGWQPNQAWLADRVRMVAARLYAQAETQGGKKGNGWPIAAHIAAITAQVSKLFGVFYDATAPQFLESLIIDFLVQFGDLGHIGHGYYIPRESRIVRLTEGWGRIAGGLPMDSSEHLDAGIQSVLQSTVGRVVKLRSDFGNHDQETEHSEVYEWTINTDETNLGNLYARLSDRTVTRPTEETTEYYNASFRRGRIRADRWHSKMPDAKFIVARTRTLPHLYYFIGAKPGSLSNGWRELGGEDARRWILSAEKMAGAVNTIRVSSNSDERTFFFPDMLPKAWTAAVLACASTVTAGKDGGWYVTAHLEALDVLELLLHSANIQLT